MFRRGISIVVISAILFLIPAFCFAEDSKMQDYEPYTEMEFSSFAIDMRRAETIFFGSLPLTFLASSLAVGMVDAVLSTDLPTTGISLGASIGLSLTIAVIDYVLGLEEENQVE